MSGRPYLRLLPGGRRQACREPVPPSVLLDSSRSRIVLEARALLVMLTATPGLLESIAADPRTRAALLPLLDAVQEYEGHAGVARVDG